MSHVLSNRLIGADPDNKIELEHRERMNVLANVLDEFFNEPGKPKTTAFALLIAPFGESKDGRVNYISNANRPEMLEMMQAYIDRNKK